MRRLAFLAVTVAAVVALSGCIMPPPLPGQHSHDAGAPTETAQTPGADAPAESTGPVWPANMASHGVLFAADGVVPTPPAAQEAVRQAVEGTSVIVYVDFQCPHCATFSAANDDELRALVDDGSITLEMRPVSFVDPVNSVRHAAAFAAVVDEFPESAWAFQSALFEHQQQGGLSDEQLVELALAVGGQSTQLESRIRSGSLLAFAETATVTGMSEPVVDDVPAPRGTPSLYVNGVAYDGPIDQPEALVDFIAEHG